MAGQHQVITLVEDEAIGLEVGGSSISGVNQLPTHDHVLNSVVRCVLDELKEIRFLLKLIQS